VSLQPILVFINLMGLYTVCPQVVTATAVTSNPMNRHRRRKSRARYRTSQHTAQTRYKQWTYPANVDLFTANRKICHVQSLPGKRLRASKRASERASETRSERARDSERERCSSDEDEHDRGGGRELDSEHLNELCPTNLLHPNARPNDGR
jgi:hypothetical protein